MPKSTFSWIFFSQNIAKSKYFGEKKVFGLAFST